MSKDKLKDKLSDEKLEQATGGAGTAQINEYFAYHCEYAPDDETFKKWVNKLGYVPCPHKSPTSASTCRNCVNLRCLTD